MSGTSERTDHDVPWDGDVWMPGFEVDGGHTLTTVESGVFRADADDPDASFDTSVNLPEVNNGEIPLQIVADGDEVRAATLTYLSPGQARELGEALLETAKIAEDDE
jgi:hypothetical protein